MKTFWGTWWTRRFDWYSARSIDHVACGHQSWWQQHKTLILAHLEIALSPFEAFFEDSWIIRKDDEHWRFMSHYETSSDHQQSSAENWRHNKHFFFFESFRSFPRHQVLRVLRTLRFFRELRLMLDCVLGSVLNAIWRPPQWCHLNPVRHISIPRFMDLWMRYMEVLSVLSCSLLCTILKDMMCCVLF